MSMPRNLIFVRHGESEANLMQGQSKNGDESGFSDEMMTIPDRTWRLTSQGQKQAETSGAWIAKQISWFDVRMVSPFIRTRETAARIGLAGTEGSSWVENRVVRERSWGEIDSMSRQRFAREYPANANYKAKDPLYWMPPGGESIAGVAENRVRNLLGTLHRETSEQNVLVVTHGEFIAASRMTLERLSDEEFLEFDRAEEHKIRNCMVFHYTREDPDDPGAPLSPRLSWVRTAYPQLNEAGEWEMIVGEWRPIGRPVLSDSELLAVAEAQARRISDDGVFWPQSDQ